MRQTPLHQAHLDAGARMVDFAGWDMPINYGSQIDEHHVVRREAGMFDVSHMCPVEVIGPQARPFLSRLFANDVAKLAESGKALYSCMLDERGGVIDDLICYYLAEDHFRVVVNAGTREKDLAWMTRQADAFDVEVAAMQDYAMIAVQGPEARSRMVGLLPEADRDSAESLKPFNAAQCGDLFVARTGYTGEDGFEIIVPAASSISLWKALLDVDVQPCGLGARDSLRLEAGMNLYGQDMDESVTPLDSGLGWTVAMEDDRAFIGRDALEAQKASGDYSKFTGVVLLDRGVLRHDQVIKTSHGEGVLTSGGFSPTLQRAIGLARIPAGEGEDCQVDIRGRLLEAKLIRPPFVRTGKPGAKMQALLDSLAAE